MGKVIENKREKESSLLKSAFALFTDKGFAKTTISEISADAGLAKGTFYLYFKDKYDLRNKLIIHKANQLFDDAREALSKQPAKSFEDELIFFADYIIRRYQEEKPLMQFISKNLSLGILQDTFADSRFIVSQRFYERYLESLKRYQVRCSSPMLLLYTIVETVSATSYHCILHKNPATIEEYLPYLHRIIREICRIFTEPQTDPQPQQTES